MGELGLEEEMSGKGRVVMEMCVGQRLGVGVPSPGWRLHPKGWKKIGLQFCTATSDASQISVPSHHGLLLPPAEGVLRLRGTMEGEDTA